MRPKENPKNQNNNYISLQEAAGLYGCTQKHMNLVARRGKLQAIKLGRNWHTTRQWLDEYKSKFNNVNHRPEKYISLGEAAKVYGCTQRHLSLVARQGKLKAKKLGRNWVTTFGWLKEYVEAVKKEKTLFAIRPGLRSIPSFKKIAVSLLVA